MTFPISPIDGQDYIIGGTTYTYNAATTSYNKKTTTINNTSITSDVIAASNDRLWANTDGSAINITLPASPSNYDNVFIYKKGTNNLVILRNGYTIANNTSDLTIDEAEAMIELIYIENTWKIKLNIIA